ncbi:MAG TPA: SAM-dependent methyltransferase, partial [Methylomirabilota bacterium]|nr:SAM-dependent methyltransferase [Methylomirabilota bacterium]
PGGLERVLARSIVLRGRPYLSFTLRHPTRDETRNLPFDEAIPWLRAQVGAVFRSALLCTTAADWQLFLPETGAPRLIRHPASIRSAPARDHDQPRRRILDATAADWLHGVGVTDVAGRPRPAMADKFRQIDRYLELVSHLAVDCGWDSVPALRVADMGCGKGYLTFALWHWLVRTRGKAAEVVGVEQRSELVAAANTVARRIEARGLKFLAGTIRSAPLPPVDALVALHACDTATDDAIRRGIELGARLIVVSPCCHKEVRPQLGRPQPVAPILDHGVMADRLAEWLTDGLRALFLEAAGYRTRVMEFIRGEHTAKNLMIAAIKTHDSAAAAAARERIFELKRFFGVSHHTLDGLLAR